MNDPDTNHITLSCFTPKDRWESPDKKRAREFIASKKAKLDALTKITYPVHRPEGEEGEVVMSADEPDEEEEEEVMSPDRAKEDGGEPIPEESESDGPAFDP